MARSFFILAVALSSFFTASCDSGEELAPTLTGTWVAVDTVSTSVNGEPLEGEQRQTYELVEEDGHVEGRYDRVLADSAGVIFAEENLTVTGSFDFPEVRLTVLPPDLPARPTRTGTMRADGEAIDFPLEPGGGAPFVLQRQE